MSDESEESKPRKKRKKRKETVPQFPVYTALVDIVRNKRRIDGVNDFDFYGAVADRTKFTRDWTSQPVRYAKDSQDRFELLQAITESLIEELGTFLTYTRCKRFLEGGGLEPKDAEKILSGFYGSPLPPPLQMHWDDLQRISGGLKGRDHKNVTEDLKVALAGKPPEGVVILFGYPGVGKTSVVAATLHELYQESRLSDVFPDGVQYYDYAPYTELREALLRSFDWPPTADLKDLLERKRALLIVDGVIKLDALNRLIDKKGTCTLLIISRSPPEGNDAGKQIPVVDLSKDEDSAVSLFKAILGKEEASDAKIKEYCHQLGGIPFLIRFVAMASSRFKSLDQYYITVPPGSSHLERIFYWLDPSVQALDDEAKGIYSLAAHLPLAWFRRDLLLKVLGSDRGIEELIRYGFVVMDGDEANLRIKLYHQLFRDYAQMHLPLEDELKEKVARYYIDLAAASVKDRENGWRNLNDEVPHLVTVFDWCLAAEKWRWALQLVLTIGDLLLARGFWAQYEAMLNGGLAALQHLPDEGESGRDSYRGVLLGRLGTLCYHRGQYDNAIAYHQSALDIAQSSGDPEGTMLYILNLGIDHFTRGDWEMAETMFLKSHGLAEQRHDQATRGRCLNQLGLLYLRQDQYRKALGSFQEALAIAQAEGDLPAQAARQSNLGLIYLKSALHTEDEEAQARHLESAAAYFDGALSNADQIGDRELAADAKANLGLTKIRAGKKKDGCRLLQEAHREFQDLGSPNVSTVLGWIEEHQCVPKGRRSRR